MKSKHAVGLLLLLSSISLLAELTLAGNASVAAESAASVAETASTTTVGMPQQLEQVVLPGSELVVRPMEDRNDPFVLRIIASYPHGTDHRYDFQYHALEPGQYNLVSHLQRADGSPTGELPPITVKVDSTLPPGQVTPAIESETEIPRLGGYRTWLWVGGIAWLAGLFALILVGRKPAEKTAIRAESEPRQEDRLQTLIEAACNGKIESEDRAELERAVISYWQNELNWTDLPPGELSTRLKTHEVAGPMLGRLEKWLHAPDGDDQIDLAQVLAPIGKGRTEVEASA